MLAGAGRMLSGGPGGESVEVVSQHRSADRRVCSFSPHETLSTFTVIAGSRTLAVTLPLSLALDPDNPASFNPMQLPWAVWLGEATLPPETWRLIGAGPQQHRQLTRVPRSTDAAK
jgi:hypothetical protein